MAHRNIVVVDGHLGADPKASVTRGGTAVTEIRICTGRARKNTMTGEWENKPVWITGVAYGSTAEPLAKYFKKGSFIMVDAELDYDEWTDKDTQQKRSMVKLFITKVHFPPKPAPKGEPQHATASAPVTNGHSEPTDAGGEGSPIDHDIPF